MDILIKRKIGKDIWESPNESDDEYLSYAIKKYTEVSDNLRNPKGSYYSLNWLDFNSKSYLNNLNLINSILTEGFELIVLKLKLNKEKLYLSHEDKIIITYQDCCKLYLCSNLHYPFWDFTYKGLYEFYKNCYKKELNFNIDLFIGRLSYLFDKVDDKNFEILEDFVNKIDAY
jgi:hypothetical protein